MIVSLTKGDPQDEFPCLAVKGGTTPEFGAKDVYILARVENTGNGKDAAYLAYKIGSNLVLDKVDPDDYVRLPAGTTITITQ